MPTERRLVSAPGYAPEGHEHLRKSDLGAASTNAREGPKVTTQSPAGSVYNQFPAF